MTNTYSLGDFVDLLLETAEYDYPDDEPPELQLTKLDITMMCARVIDALGCDCQWCGIDTMHEWYMVTDEIWSQYGPPAQGYLCIGCLEDRMGRQLKSADFIDAPVNTDGDRCRSDRLTDRLSS